MRKIKKINGYLVVRFNDREKREYEGTALGSFGVIDAELYTGVLDIDRSAMEYDNAETLETAIELARGLEAELDVAEPEVKVTVMVESETEIHVTEANAEELLLEEKAWLLEELTNGRHPGLTSNTAAHWYTGYARALEDLGIISSPDDQFMDELSAFSEAGTTFSEQREEALAYICDEICKHRIPGRTQEELEAICEKCRVDRWSGDPPTLTPEEVRQLRACQGFLKELNDYVNSGKKPPVADQDTFKNVPSGIRNNHNTKKAYALGLMLAQECPDNDCRVYLNIFNMARELDAALDKVDKDTAPARVLRSALTERTRELWQMYENNYAIQKFREGAKS